MRRLRVMLEYFHPWTNSAGLYWARERGYYAERDLDVEVPSGEPAGSHYLTAGEGWTVHGDREISIRLPGIAGLRIDADSRLIAE